MLLLKIALFSLVLANVLLRRSNFTELLFQQHDYKVEFERVELVNFSKTYVKSFQAITFKYNRTSPVVNVTYEYSIDLDYDVEIVIQAYTFLSNEYRFYPIRFEVNFCHAVSKNYAGLGNLFNCGNFIGCPAKKGKLYHHCNWSPDTSQLPPLIPNGNYMVELQGLYHDMELFLLRAYSRVYRPIVIP